MLEMHGQASKCMIEEQTGDYTPMFVILFQKLKQRKTKSNGTSEWYNNTFIPK